MASASLRHPCYQHQHHLSRVMVVAWSILCVMSGQLATAKADDFPPTMTDSLTSLKTYLKYHGMPSKRLFPTHLNEADAEESGDKILAGERLKVFSKILSAMQSKIQNQTTIKPEDKKARDDLENLKRKIDELRSAYFKKHQTLLDKLQTLLDNVRTLQQTDVNDEQVQRKAFFELKHVYNHASAVGVASAGNTTMRRRRQIRPLWKTKP